MNILVSIFGFACLGIFLLAFGGGGVYLIYLSRKNSALAQGSQNWLSTAATITQSEVGQSSSSDHDGPRTYYRPVVEYTYQVGAQTYTGKRIAFGPAKASARSASVQAALGKYPQGGAVTVYYDPNNPAEAVLEKQAAGTTAMLVLGIVFLAVTVCLALPGIIVAVLGTFSSSISR
jgi:hypothetical protein